MIFRDRVDAGKKLAEKLLNYYQAAEAIVIGLPRGGVPVAYEVASRLNLPLDIVCPRKIGAPFNKELAIGAITETGDGIFNQELINRLKISTDYIKMEVEKEALEAKHRLNTYRSGRPSRHLMGKTVIIVDDGLATGSTMKAAIRSIHNEHPEKIIAAVPVSPLDTLKEVRKVVDEVVYLEAPLYFEAVGQFYNEFSQTTDSEVIKLLSSKLSL